MSCEKKSEMFSARDLQLCDKRNITRNLMKVFNQTGEDEKDKRQQIIKELLSAVGSGAWVEPPWYVEFGKNTSLGNEVFFNYNCVILDACPVTVGDFVLFGPGVQIYATPQLLNPPKRRSKSDYQSIASSVEIGSDVWVGGCSIICPGVKIGQGSVIGAGSVVTEDIPPNSLAVGNPCRVIRTLNDENSLVRILPASGSEKEKMLKGEYYNYMDPQLCEERDHARNLMKAFNDSSADENEKRKKIVKELFGEVWEAAWVEPPFYCDYGCNITLGKNVQLRSGCTILDVCPVTVGDNTILESSVQVYTPTHRLRADERRAELDYGKSVTIGSDVLVGGGAILCPGVKIGNGSVIRPGSVVTKDLPPNVLAAGNPCRVIRELKV